MTTTNNEGEGPAVLQMTVARYRSEESFYYKKQTIQYFLVGLYEEKSDIGNVPI